MYGFGFFFFLLCLEKGHRTTFFIHWWVLSRQHKSDSWCSAFEYSKQLDIISEHFLMSKEERRDTPTVLPSGKEDMSNVILTTYACVFFTDDLFLQILTFSSVLNVALIWYSDGSSLSTFSFPQTMYFKKYF